MREIEAAEVPGGRRQMRLSTHLFISHAIPVVIVTLALGMTLTALARISLVLAGLRDAELVTLREEGELHRAAWALDVAMRHGHAGCAAGRAETEAHDRVWGSAEDLRARVARAAVSPMKDLALAYLEVADEVLSGDACAQLLGGRVQSRRAQLDEEITDLWVGRLSELHEAVSTRDEQARGIAVSSIWVGIPVALVSFVLAMGIARRTGRLVREPLETLARMAQRVGRGDFRTSVEVEAPAEIAALAGDLEQMRRQLQELETLKQGFLASVSHELRTPLAKIREALALLGDGAVGTFEPRQSRVIQIARGACEQEIRLVTTLLDLSRLRAGSPLRFRDGTSIDSVLAAAVEDERAEANNRNVNLSLELRGEGVTGRQDPVLLERAFANLIRNAVSVSKSGQSVVVERDLERDRPGRPGTWVKITVTDQGPGVPEEIRDRLFEAFVTHPVRGSAKAVGVGLGLALAREVAQAHGGDVDLSVPEGGGTVFHIWLPIVEAAPIQPHRDIHAEWEKEARTTP